MLGTLWGVLTGSLVLAALKSDQGIAVNQFGREEARWFFLVATAGFLYGAVRVFMKFHRHYTAGETDEAWQSGVVSSLLMLPVPIAAAWWYSSSTFQQALVPALGVFVWVYVAMVERRARGARTDA